MGKIVLIYSKLADKRLSKFDKNISFKIIKEIEKNVSRKDPLINAESLKGAWSDYYRYRVGDYRVIFYIDSKGKMTIITIITVGHRKNVYNK